MSPYGTDGQTDGRARRVMRPTERPHNNQTYLLKNEMLTRTLKPMSDNQKKDIAEIKSKMKQKN